MEFQRPDAGFGTAASRNLFSQKALLALGEHSSSRQAETTLLRLDQLLTHNPETRITVWIESASGGHPGVEMLERADVFRGAVTSGSPALELAGSEHPAEPFRAVLLQQFSYGQKELERLTALEIISAPSASAEFNFALAGGLRERVSRHPQLAIAVEPVNFDSWLSFLRLESLSLILNAEVELNKFSAAEQTAFKCMSALSRNGRLRDALLAEAIGNSKDNLHFVIRGHAHQLSLSAALESRGIAAAVDLLAPVPSTRSLLLSEVQPPAGVLSAAARTEGWRDLLQRYARIHTASPRQLAPSTLGELINGLPAEELEKWRNACHASSHHSVVVTGYFLLGHLQTGNRHRQDKESNGRRLA